MAAQIEKVVVRTDIAEFKYFRPNAGEYFFEKRLRWGIPAAGG